MRPRLPIWALQERGRSAVAAILRGSAPIASEDEPLLHASALIMPWAFEYSLHIVRGIDLGRTLAKATIEWSSRRLDCERLWPTSGPAPELREGGWRPVAAAMLGQWRACFDAERRLVNLRGACPACGEQALHRYFGSDGQKGYRGACCWEWCRRCGTYLYKRGASEWWSGPGPDWISTEEEPGELEVYLAREGVLQSGAALADEAYTPGLPPPVLSPARANDPSFEFAFYWRAREQLRQALATAGVTPETSGMTEVCKRTEGPLVITEVQQYQTESAPPRTLARAVTDTSRSVEPLIELLVQGGPVGNGSVPASNEER